MKIKTLRNTYTINSGYFTVNLNMPSTVYQAFVQERYGAIHDYFYIVQEYTATTMYVYVRKLDGTLPPDGSTTEVNILILYS